MTLKEKLYKAQERRNDAAQAMAAIHAKSDGKPGEMPSGDQDTFENVEKAFDGAVEEIRQLEKAIAAEEIMAKAVDTLKVAGIDPYQPISQSVNGSDAVKNFIGMFFKTGRADVKLAAGVTVGDSARGGVLVGREFYSEIIQIVENVNWMRRLATVFPLSPGVGIFELPVIETNISLPSPTSELGSVDENDLTLGLRELKPRIRATRMRVGRLAEIQSAFDVWNIVSQQFAYVKAEKEEREFLTGNGANEALGVFTENALGFGSAQTVTTAAVNTFSGDDVLDVLTNLRSQFRVPGACWVMHRNTFGRVRKLKDASNNYLYSSIGEGVYNAQFLTGSLPGQLQGYPVYLSEYAPDPGRTGNITAGTRLMAVGDFRRGYAIGDSIDTEIVPLDQLNFPAKQWGLVTAYDGRPWNQDAISFLEQQ
jgi:HK97 family phage major capsid protein